MDLSGFFSLFKINELKCLYQFRWLVLSAWRLKHWIAKNDGWVSQWNESDSESSPESKHLMKWWKMFQTGYLDHLYFVVVRVLFIIIFIVFTYLHVAIAWLINAFVGNIAFYSAHEFHMFFIDSQAMRNGLFSLCWLLLFYWTELIITHLLIIAYFVFSVSSAIESCILRRFHLIMSSLKIRTEDQPQPVWIKVNFEIEIQIRDLWLNFNKKKIILSSFVSKGNHQNGIKAETSPRYHQCGRTPPNTPVGQSLNGHADPYRNARNANRLTTQNPNRRMCQADLHLRSEHLSGNSTATTDSANSSFSSYGNFSSTESSDPNSMFSPGQKRQPLRRSTTQRSKCLTYSLPSKTEWEDSSTSSDESFYSPKK